jgi:hypothetical protein
MQPITSHQPQEEAQLRPKPSSSTMAPFSSLWKDLLHKKSPGKQKLVRYQQQSQPEQRSQVRCLPQCLVVVGRQLSLMFRLIEHAYETSIATQASS